MKQPKSFMKQINSHPTIQQSCLPIFPQTSGKRMSTQKPACGCVYSFIDNCHNVEATETSSGHGRKIGVGQGMRGEAEEER